MRRLELVLIEKSLIKLKDILTSGLFFKKDELQSYIESFKFSQDIQDSSILSHFLSFKCFVPTSSSK